MDGLKIPPFLSFWTFLDDQMGAEITVLFPFCSQGNACDQEQENVALGDEGGGRWGERGHRATTGRIVVFASLAQLTEMEN